ncbi:hypothetical protein SAMN04488061_1955 [Filomicrobium insigne]|uniref:Uncharacterized protein n=1 Tax=Filomicrobium insigne TaxID=418854 RepID=A0A1H0NBD2_9HYPH|nr:hypothetical protein [Filomicrobium insigne]SDO89836.1 hypothetical protein SAMN04488061_1955 [Filomicrobium insigne]
MSRILASLFVVLALATGVSAAQANTLTLQNHCDDPVFQGD